MLFNDSFLDLIDGYYLFSDWIMNHALFWKKQWCWSIHLRDWVGIGGWWVIKTAHQRKATILIITRDEMLVINMFEPPPTATIRKQTLRCGSPPIKFPRACSKKRFQVLQLVMLIGFPTNSKISQATLRTAPSSGAHRCQEKDEIQHFRPWGDCGCAEFASSWNCALKCSKMSSNTVALWGFMEFGCALERVQNHQFPTHPNILWGFMGFGCL